MVRVPCMYVPAAVPPLCCASCCPTLNTGGPEGASRLLRTPVAQAVVDSASRHNQRLSAAATSDYHDEPQDAEVMEGPAVSWQSSILVGGDLQAERQQHASVLRKLSNRLSSMQEGGAERGGEACDDGNAE